MPPRTSSRKTVSARSVASTASSAKTSSRKAAPAKAATQKASSLKASSKKASSAKAVPAKGAAAGGRGAASPVRRGRPAQLSRERVLNCALHLLEQGPAAVTISAVARALKCAPMSLYTHVTNRDDLLLGVSDLVLGQIAPVIADDTPWLTAVQRWLFAVHAQLARYPQVVGLLGEEKSLPPQWLRVHAILIRWLQRGGLHGELLANAARWLAQLVIADILLNPPAQPQLREKALGAALVGIAAEDRAGFEEMLPHLLSARGSLFEFGVEQALARLEVLAR